MSRTPLLASSLLPTVALSCLVTGCLDENEVPVDPPKDPLVLIAVAGSPAQALPPKPALAQLATATDATRERYIDAALGADVSDVFNMVMGLSLSRASTCPVVGHRGDLMFSVPDCTDGNGVHWSGRLRSQSWSDSHPMEIKLERWRVDPPGERDDKAYEGTVTIYPDGRFAANLVTARDGFVSRTFATWRVEDGKVIAGEDSWVIVQEHGIAQIGGAWRFPRDGQPSGDLVLDGADQLVLDIDSADATCAPISVDGEPVGKHCNLAELAGQLGAFSLF